jgi:hypothetical protein
MERQKQCAVMAHLMWALGGGRRADKSDEEEQVHEWMSSFFL